LQWAENFLPGFDRVEAEQLAAFMKVDLDMRVGGMSRGQEARLMLILCIARQVPLIILDEPFSGIDVVSRERIIDGLIDHMSHGDHTVLISTHEIYEAESLFDYVVFLNEGQVVLAGEADALRGQYGSMHSIVQQLYR
jgi:ABC-2 type transport system ATP-binding protein